MMYFKEELLEQRAIIAFKNEKQCVKFMDWLKYRGYNSCKQGFRRGKNKDGIIFIEINEEKTFNIEEYTYAEAIDYTKSQIIDPAVEGWAWDGAKSIAEKLKLYSIDFRCVYPFRIKKGCFAGYENFSLTKPRLKPKYYLKPFYSDEWIEVNKIYYNNVLSKDINDFFNAKIEEVT